MKAERATLAASPAGTFRGVKQHKRSIGVSCMHCNRSATVTASVKLRNKMRFDVRYCERCATERGAI